MNDRHRRIGSAAQGKVVTWLSNLTDEAVARMSVADATRLLDTAVRIERAATSDGVLEDLPDCSYAEPGREEGSLKERLEQSLVEAGLDPDVELPVLARFLHELDRPPEPPPPPTPALPPRQAPPPEPEPTSGETPPPIDIWGDRSPFGTNRYGGPM
jgi:hypothetical protein